jgi:hypothetical protein
VIPGIAGLPSTGLLCLGSAFAVDMPYWQTLNVQPYHTICVNTKHRRVASALMKYIDSTLSAEILSSFSCIPAILPHPLPTTSDVKTFHLNGKHAGGALGTQGTVTANHFINVFIECKSNCVAVPRACVFHGHSYKNLYCEQQAGF